MQQDTLYQEEANKLIGETLKTMRRRSGITQKELAHRLHTTQSFISAIEQGKRAIRLTETILYSSGLDMPSQELYEELKSTLVEHDLL
jgi:transcriptional regulator with XRE-family HTH domain